MFKVILVLFFLFLAMPNVWSFRLSLDDYEIKSNGVIEAEIEESVGKLNAELPNHFEDGEGLLSGDEEIILIDSQHQTGKDSNQGTPSRSMKVPLNFYTISELNQNQFHGGTYETEGYVVFIYQCGCIQVASCKPCMENNIIVSSDNIIKSSYTTTHNDIIVFSKDIKRFDLGKKYRFIIQILDVKTTSQILNNIKLIYLEKIES